MNEHMALVPSRPRDKSQTRTIRSEHFRMCVEETYDSAFMAAAFCCGPSKAMEICLIKTKKQLKASQ